MATLDQLKDFIGAIERVYGPLAVSKPEQWNPPPLPSVSAHRGRQLWTDAIGVLNLLTLHHEITTAEPPLGNPKSKNILILAQRLVAAVHDTLGYTRDGTSRLRGATDEEPLKGGLRSGNIDEDGPIKDGQYHHHLTMWMFALNRVTMASKDPKYNDQAIALAEAIHPFFFHKKKHEMRMVWKCSTGLTEVLICTEGDLDPMGGHVLYSILQATHRRLQGGNKNVLENEMKDYDKIMARHCGFQLSSGDPLELGLTLWTAQWFFDQTKVQQVMNMHVQRLITMHLKDHYFSQKLELRVAFREFVACIGIGCVIGSLSSMGKDVDHILESVRKRIIDRWHDALTSEMVPDALKPVTDLTFAAAMLPGAFRAGYYGPEPISDVDMTKLRHVETEYAP